MATFPDCEIHSFGFRIKSNIVVGIFFFLSLTVFALGRHCTVHTWRMRLSYTVNVDASVVFWVQSQQTHTALHLYHQATFILTSACFYLVQGGPPWTQWDVCSNHPCWLCINLVDWRQRASIRKKTPQRRMWCFTIPVESPASLWSLIQNPTLD